MVGPFRLRLCRAVPPYLGVVKMIQPQGLKFPPKCAFLSLRASAPFFGLEEMGRQGQDGDHERAATIQGDPE